MEQPGVAAPAAGVTTVPAGTQPPAPPAQPNQPAAGAPGGQPPGGVPPAGPPAAPPQEVKVPVTVVQALRDEVQQAKQRAEQFEQQLNIYRANMGQGYQQPPQAPPQPPPPPASPFEGMRDDDVLTVADVKKIVERLPSNAHPSSDPELRAMVMKMEVAQADPQYETTIRTYLPEVLAADPTLRHAIIASPNPLRTALSLSRTSPRFLAARQQAAGGTPPGAPPSPMDQLALILQNLDKPGNPGAFGSAPAGGGGPGVYAAMTDAEFDARVKAVKGGY